nr:protein 125 [synthetic construct]
MRTPLLAVLAIMAFLATTAVCEEAREVVTLDDGTELQMHGDEDLSGPKRQLMKKALFGDPVPIPEYDVCVPTMFGCSNDFWCNPEYNLTDAGFGFCQITWPEQERAFAVGLFKKLSWQIPHGSETEKKVLRGFQWVAFAFSLGVLAYYAYNSWKATTGWEEVYVCIVELIKVCLEIWHEPDHPATLYLSAGNFILWLRYGEWLLTCPVILIHLSNLTGLKDNYSKRTMMLLISDIGCIVWGVTSALTTLTWLKWFFFFIGLCYGLSTFFHAGRVYIESYMMLPKGQCRKILRIMAGVYYFSWSAFPILFILGPEGFGHISAYASTIGHTINDMLSKQLWTLLGHHLRNLIHIHIIKHGNLTRKTKMTFLGQDVEVEEMVEEEGDDTV